MAQLYPIHDGLTQLRLPYGERVAREAVEVIDQRLADEGGRRVLGFADVELDAR